MRARHGVPPRETTSIEVPLQLFPRLPETSQPFPLLLGLHGYGMHAATLFPLLARMAPDGWGVVAVEGPQSAFLPGEALGPAGARGFHWGVSPRHEDNQAVHRAAVAAAIAWGVERGADPSRVSLLGFSQPCSFNYRLSLAPPHGRRSAPSSASAAACRGNGRHRSRERSLPPRPTRSTSRPTPTSSTPSTASLRSPRSSRRASRAPGTRSTPEGTGSRRRRSRWFEAFLEQHG